MKDFSKDILNTLEKNKVEPLPRWVFFARQAGLVGAFLMSVIIGGISVSVILVSLFEAADPGMGRMMRMHPGPFLLTYLPYAWVVVMVLFGIASYVEMRHTKTGYRYRAITIVSASVLASVLLGLGLHAVGAGRAVDRRFSEAIPQYRGLDARKMHLWMQPQAGMLAGRIVSGGSTTTFVIEDFSGVRWIVESDAAELHGVIKGELGERVRVAGSVAGPGVFRASDLFPWERPGVMRSREMMWGGEQRGMLLRERNVRTMP